MVSRWGEGVRRTELAGALADRTSSQVPVNSKAGVGTVLRGRKRRGKRQERQRELLIDSGSFVCLQ